MIGNACAFPGMVVSPTKLSVLARRLAIGWVASCLCSVLASSAIAGLITALILRDRWVPAALLQKFWLAPILAMLAVAWQLRFFFA